MRRYVPQPDTKLEMVNNFVDLLMQSEMERIQNLIDSLIVQNNALNFTSNNRFRHAGKVWQHSDNTLVNRELATPLDHRLVEQADMLSHQWETTQSDKKRIVQCLRVIVTHANTLEDWRNLLPDEFAKYFKDPISRTRQQSEAWSLTEPQKRDYASVLLLIKKYSGLAIFN